VGTKKQFKFIVTSYWEFAVRFEAYYLLVQNRKLYSDFHDSYRIRMGSSRYLALDLIEFVIVWYVDS